MHATCHFNPYRALPISNTNAVCPCLSVCTVHSTYPAPRIVRLTGLTESAEFLIMQFYIVLLSPLCYCHHSVTVATPLLSPPWYCRRCVSAITMLLSLPVTVTIPLQSPPCYFRHCF